MQNKKDIIYIGNFHFPDGNAAGKRVAANANLFRNLGYKVTIVDTQQSSGSSIKLSNEKEVDGFKCYSLPYPKGTSGWLKFRNTYDIVRNLIESREYKHKVFAVVLYGSPVLSVFNLFLTLYCKKNNIKVIVDCVDWLSVKTKSIFFDTIKFIDDYMQKVWFNAMADGVICISEYLSNYYQNKGKVTVVVPPLNSKETIDIYEPLLDDIATFIYAGRPFRNDMKKDDSSSLKDRIDLVLNIFSDLKSKGYQFKLNILGFSSEELTQCMPCCSKWLKELADNVSFHGHVSNDVVVNLLKKSHFSILLRDNKRDSVAGFPTKVAESIYSGTPVLVTDLGDLNKYIESGVHGYLLPITDYEAQLSVVENVLKLSKEEILKLKVNSLNSECFNVSSYEDVVSKFISKI